MSLATRLASTVVSIVYTALLHANAPALGCNGYITSCLEQNRHLLSKLTETGFPSPVFNETGVPLHQSTCLGELYIFGFFIKNIISLIPLRDFAFSGSQKLKNPLASQGRRLEAGVAKDLGGGRYPEARGVWLA